MAASQVERLGPLVIDDGDVAALAGLIADHLTERLAPKIAELVEAGANTDSANESTIRSKPKSLQDGGSRDPAALWTVPQVATHYGVTPSFVYQHADELGCIRLGGGARPRLRFDPRIVHERLHRLGALPDAAPTRHRSPRRKGEQLRRGRRAYELLEYDRKP